MLVTSRDFGGGNQPEIRVLALEEVLGKLGKLASAIEAGGIHQEGRQHLGVAVFARVHVQEKVDQCPFQFGAQPPVKRKARARDFAGAGEIQNPQLGSQIPMRFGLEIELRRFAGAAHLHVVGFRFADRDGLVGNIRNAGQQLLELLVYGVHLVVERRDSLSDSANFLLPLRGVGAFALELADLDGFLVLARLQLLCLGNRRTAPGIQVAETLQVDRATTGRETFRYALEVAPEEGEIVHVLPCYRMAGLFFLILNFHGL